jgi:hypothetical protein
LRPQWAKSNLTSAAGTSSSAEINDLPQPELRSAQQRELEGAIDSSSHTLAEPGQAGYRLKARHRGKRVYVAK